MAEERFDDKGFVALGLTFAAVLLTATMCKVLGFGETVGQAFSAAAAGIPVAIFRVRRRARQLTTGQRERTPIGYRIAVVGVVFLLYDTFVGVVEGFMGDTVGPLLGFASVIPVFFVTRALATRLRSRPYLVLLGGFLLALAGRVLVAFGLFPGLAEQFGPGVLFGIIVLSYAINYGMAALGVRLAPAVPRLVEPVQVPYAGAAPSVFGRSAQFVDTAAHAAPRATFAAPPPPPGWYPDPELRGVVRWWDGSSWTDYRHNA